MPPKTKVSRSEVLSAGVRLTRTLGFDSVNARSLAADLNCSAKPLFRLYKNMNELKQDVFQRINTICSDALHAERPDGIPELKMAFNYVAFARSEPHLFKALFMNGAVTPDTLPNLLNEPEIEQLLQKLAEDHNLALNQAQSVFKKTWLMAHGIASLLAANGRIFSEAEAEKLLSEAFTEFLTAGHGRPAA